MPSPISRSTALVLVALFALSACESSVQTSSGRDYLQSFPDHEAGAELTGLDQAVIEAADVEPLLTFPARIGLARIDRGKLTPVPQAEAGHWRDLAQELSSGWGEFVPISPLIAAFTRQDVYPYGEIHCPGYSACLGQVVRSVRLGAARQHVDAVLIYEGTAWSDSTSNPLAIANLTIIGYWLAPSKNVEAGAAAQALLLDVRNGYTYGLAQAEISHGTSRISTPAGSDDMEKQLREDALARAVEALVPEVETMLRDLRLELAETRLQRLATKAPADLVPAEAPD